MELVYGIFDKYDFYKSLSVREGCDLHHLPIEVAALFEILFP